MSSVGGGMDAGSGNSGLGLGTKITERNRRSWSDKEEECLLAALKNLVSLGWKSDNGFKGGYLKKLEAAMKSKFPTTDLRGTPHINSKMTQWKKSYNSLSYILSRSGVGFNSRGDYMIECENDQWEQIIKLDTNARNMRYKPWPYYDDWSQIFGKDRATGEMAEDIMDAWNEISFEENPANGTSYEDFNPFGNDLNGGEGQDDSVSQAAKHNNPPMGKSKKRKTGGDLDGVCEVLGEIGNKADMRLSELVKRIGFDFDVKDTKKEAFKLLDLIPGLSLQQKFIVCQILAKELDKLDVFMGLPDEERPSYVLFILEEAGKLDP